MTVTDMLYCIDSIIRWYLRLIFMVLFLFSVLAESDTALAAKVEDTHTYEEKKQRSDGVIKSIIMYTQCLMVWC
jgi:hypothetical protein